MRPKKVRLAFKRLSLKQEREFRTWARLNYKPGDTINQLWHPVVRDECHKINYESLFEKMKEVGD